MLLVNRKSENLIMTKHELIQALKESSNLTKFEATQCVELFFNTIADALLRGDRVEIRGLCSLHVKEYESYTGRNPKTGVEVTVKTKRLPFFKAGTDLRKRVYD